MQIQKNAAAPAAKTTSTLKTQPQIKHSAPQAVPQTLTKSAAIPRSISSLISNLNLPNDKVSANLLPLFRFFSLSMKPEQLNEIRRQVFTALPEIIKQTAAEKPADTAADKTRSILLLAASAAESKGVELSPKGLEHFAEAIDPEWEERQGDKQNKDKRNKNKDKQEEDETINGVVLQKKANESEENNPLLLIMNKLPGKNKQRWITLPFEFSQNGRNFRVSMRVLVDGDNAVFTALDIVEPGKDFRYSFALEFENNKVSKVCMYVDDQTIPSSLRSKQLKDLTKLFDIPAGNVSIKAGLENPAETEFGEKLLCFVDEAV